MMAMGQLTVKELWLLTHKYSSRGRRTRLAAAAELLRRTDLSRQRKARDREHFYYRITQMQQEETHGTN